MRSPPGRSVDAWGVQTTWLDASGTVRTVPPETVRLLHDRIGRRPADHHERSPIVTRPGRRLTGLVGEVALEDGTSARVDGKLPGDFPLGYHRLLRPDGRQQPLIVSPGRCWLPEQRRSWGWSVQLYAARSRSSWGIGDLADLRRLREWAQREGAGFLLVNPLHAAAPGLPQEPSPYLPTSRRFLNLLYADVEQAPGAAATDLTDLIGLGRARNADRRIDRDAVYALKNEGLRRVFASTPPDHDFAAWQGAKGPSLAQFAAFMVLAERHGPDWRSWPARLRDPATAVPAVSDRHPHDVVFHAWVQWVLDLQLSWACEGLAVVQDLPVGVFGGGADAWVWQDQFARETTIGAPADAFNSSGQDWGAPPLVPWRLRQSGYAPFIESVRATVERAGGLRIDHAMGLFRLWWVPRDGPPAGGAYVRYLAGDLLDILALESHRARALVVGEDLGTVEDGVHQSLLEHGLLSYRVLWLEADDPSSWPVQSLAAVTTHDLPTVAGLWSGADLADQLDHGVGDRAELVGARNAMLARLGQPPGGSTLDAVLFAHRRLARAPSMLTAATLEDVAVEVRRPNLPGVGGRDNWSLALPQPLEDLTASATAAAIARTLREEA